MNLIDELEKLIKKYYGYVADLEGSSIEAFDLLFVRDRMQSILEKIKPNDTIPQPLYERVYTLDSLLWQEKRSFLTVVGEKELKHAREQQKAPRSHWWWYIDELKATPTLYGAMEQNVLWKQKDFLVEAFVQTQMSSLPTD